eukprot:366499-Chlamydomonas_euryale.AAC.4
MHTWLGSFGPFCDSSCSVILAVTGRSRDSSSPVIRACACMRCHKWVHDVGSAVQPVRRASRGGRSKAHPYGP